MDERPLGGPRPLNLLGRSVPLPRSRPLRIFVGVMLVLLGMLGFLPILGFWMIPLGLLVLSSDFALVRRRRRRMEVWWGNRRGRNRQARGRRDSGGGGEA